MNYLIRIQDKNYEIAGPSHGKSIDQNSNQQKLRFKNFVIPSRIIKNRVTHYD